MQGQQLVGFPRSVFLADAFDAKAFVESRLGGADDGRKLDSIVSELKATVQDLTDELLALIDRDHQTFLELSGDLVRVDATVGTLRAPLTHLKDKVEAVKRATSGPAEAIREFDDKLASLRAKKKMLKERMAAKALRQSIEKDLLANDEARAAQRLALLARVVPEHELADLRRDLEHRLSEKLVNLPKDEVAKRLRSFAMMGAVETARRSLMNDLTHFEDEALLNRVITGHSNILQACSEQGLGTVFEFPSKSILAAMKMSVGKIISSKDARKAEALRQIVSRLSATGTPHAPLRWNPRMHSELRFQDAVNVFEENGNDLQALRISLKKLYEEELALDVIEQQDLLLSSQLFRMACRLVSGYIFMLETKEFEEHLIIAQTNDAYRLRTALLEESLLNPPNEWGKGRQVLQSLANRAAKAGSKLLNSLQKVIAESCVREITALERVVTTTYRMSGKPLSDAPSPTASKVLVPLNEVLDQLLVEGASQPDGLAEWTNAIVEELRNQYLAMADSVCKRETSLLRLHQRTNKAGISDSQKITKQLALDSARFVSDVATIMERRLRVKGFNRSRYQEIVIAFDSFGETSAPANTGVISGNATSAEGELQ